MLWPFSIHDLVLQKYFFMFLIIGVKFSSTYNCYPFVFKRIIPFVNFDTHTPIRGDLLIYNYDIILWKGCVLKMCDVYPQDN